MADITSSLFPETQGLLQQQQRDAYNQAANLASGGYANAALAAGMGASAQYGQQAGQALNSLFGVKSQDQQEAEAVKAIAAELTKQGYKLQSYEGMTKMAEALNNKSLFNAAGKAMAAANILLKGQTDIQKTQAETGFKQAESAYKQTQGNKIILDYSNEQIAKKTARAALEAQSVDPVQIEAIINNPKARDSYLKQVDEKTQTVEADGRVKLINKTDGSVVADLGAAQQRGTNISIETKAEGEFLKTMAVGDAKRIETAQTAKSTAINELSTLSKMAELDSKQLITGSMATGRMGTANFFNTVGLASQADAAKLANSEQFTKVSGDLILAKIKALGTNPSNTDREFIANIIPRLENSAAARKELVDYLAKRARDVVSEATAIETYGRKHRSLEGYTPKMPLFFGETTKSVKDMTDAELLAAARAAQQKGK